MRAAQLKSRSFSHRAERRVLKPHSLPNHLVLRLPQGVQVPTTPMAVAQGSMAVPVATPIPASIQQVVPVPVQPQTEQMQLIVPQGSGPGSVINVQAPCGRQVQVTVPAGYMPGMPMVVQI
jgi:hypothetical protein